jgi:hypothetical protein
MTNARVYFARLVKTDERENAGIWRGWRVKIDKVRRLLEALTANHASQLLTAREKNEIA